MSTAPLDPSMDKTLFAHRVCRTEFAALRDETCHARIEPGGQAALEDRRNGRVGSTAPLEADPSLNCPIEDAGQFICEPVGERRILASFEAVAKRTGEQSRRQGSVRIG